MAAARAVAGTEIVAVDAMQVYRGMDIGTAKPTAADRAAVTHHGLDLADPSDDFTVSDYRAAYDAAMPGIAGRPLLVAGTGLYLAAVVDRLDIPGRWPAVRAELESASDLTALHRRLAELDPVAAARIEPGNRRRIVRALEVVLGSGRPFSSYGPGLQAYPPAHATLIGLRWSRSALGERITGRVGTMMDSGLLAEVERVPCGRDVADRPSGARIQGAPASTSTAGRRWPAPSPRSSCEPGSSPSARNGGSAETLAYAGSMSTATRWPRCSRS